MLTTFWHFHPDKTFSARKFKNAKATKGNKGFPKLLISVVLGPASGPQALQAGPQVGRAEPSFVEGLRGLRARLAG